MRPKSIELFERFYLAALLVSVVANAIGYRGAAAGMEARFAVIPGWEGFGAPAFYASAALGVIVPLLLWYFVTRRASVVAKWIVVAQFALGAAGMAMALVQGSLSLGLLSLLSVLGFALRAAAVHALFRPDAKAWLASKPAEPDEAVAE